MTFELSPSFVIGIERFDEDHRELVSRINVIQAAGQAGDAPGLTTALHTFRSELAHHFRAEEEYLVKLAYPKLGSHAEHHSEILAALDRMIADLDCGGIDLLAIANKCFAELIAAVLRRDMQFANWLADQDMRNLRRSDP